MTEHICELTPIDSETWETTIGVEVVRCRDCKHCMSYWKSDYCDYFSHVTSDPNGFCAWGERRESE